MAVVSRLLVGNSQGLSVRLDGQAVDRISARKYQPQNRVATLVERHQLALALAQYNRPRWTQLDLFQGIHEVLKVNRVFTPLRCQECGFVDQVVEVRSDQPWGGSSDLRQAHVGGEWYRSGVYLQNRFESHAVGWLHHHAPIEATRSE